MSTLKSSAEDLTLNADGSGNDIKFQSNGVEKASIDQDGLVTCAGATMSGNIAFNSDGIVSSTAGFMQLSAEDSMYLNYDTDNGGGEAFNIRKGTTARFTIDNAGDVAISAGDLIFGTAGKGICLGVTSNTDSNTLDDYEEGTFTAGLTPGSGSITINGSYNTMSYTKIGRLVYCAGYISISGESSAGGSLKLTGLPFTVRNNNDAKCSMSFWANGLASNEIIEWIGECVPVQEYCYLYRGASGTITDDCTSDVDSSFDMRFMFTYTTDS